MAQSRLTKPNKPCLVSLPCRTQTTGGTHAIRLSIDDGPLPTSPLAPCVCVQLRQAPRPAVPALEGRCWLRPADAGGAGWRRVKGATPTAACLKASARRALQAGLASTSTTPHCTARQGLGCTLDTYFTAL